MPGEAPVLKPRTITEILDAAFRLYRENFITFLGILAVAYVPVTLIIMAVTGALYAGVSAPDMQDPATVTPEVVQKQVMVSLVLVAVSVVLYALAIPFATGALTQAVGRTYLNEKVSLGQSYAAVGRVFLPYLGTVLLKGLVTALGLMACVVPGILFLIWFVFAAEVCILEGPAGTNAMGRSKDLVKGYAGSIIGMGILTWIIQVVLTIALNMFSGFILPKLTDSLVINAVSSQAIAQVMTMLLQPFIIVAWILLYYDLRIRKEAFDLEVLARAMGTAKPAAPPA